MSDAQLRDFFVITVTKCVRCTGDHEDVNFYKFNVPCGELTHWGMCKTNQEPILLRIVDGEIMEDM